MSKFILESRYEDVNCKSNASCKASYSKKRKKKSTMLSNVNTAPVKDPYLNSLCRFTVTQHHLSVKKGNEV